MAETWGDIIGRNYLTGRAIGNDFAATRYARRAQKLKDEYEARAAQEGKPLETYMPEIEQRLEELAVKVGATRRGVKGDDGRPIDRSYRDRFYEDADLGAQRRASRQVLDGNVAEGYRTMAESRGALGRLGDTLTFGQAAGETAAVAGAIDPKSGAFDPAKAATGRAANAAKFGQGDIANTQYQQARQFRLQAAAGIGGQLLNALFDAQKAPVSNDYVRGLFEGMKQYVPEALGRRDLVVDPKTGVWTLFTNGQATDSWDPKNPADVEEFAGIVKGFVSAPEDTLNSYVKGITERRTAERDRTNKIDDEFRTAMIDVVKSAKAVGIPETLAVKLATAGTGQGEAKGWQLQEIGAEPGSYMVQKDGNVYIVKTNVPASLESGEPGGTLVVEDAAGNRVDPNVLNRGPDGDGFQFVLQTATELAALGNRQQLQWMQGQLQALNRLRDAWLGGSSGAPQQQQQQPNAQPQGALPPLQRATNAAGESIYIDPTLPPDVQAAIRGARDDAGIAANISRLDRGKATMDSPAAAARPVAPSSAPASGALPSAPPARNRKPQITREVLYQQADELRTLNAEIERREAALARMEKELGVGADTVNTRLDGAIRVPRGRPEDIAVYQRLQRELGQLVTRRDELTDEVRANTEAFRRAQEQRQRQQRETDLYNRYGGAADFLNRIK